MSTVTNPVNLIRIRPHVDRRRSGLACDSAAPSSPGAPGSAAEPGGGAEILPARATAGSGVSFRRALHGGWHADRGLGESEELSEYLLLSDSFYQARLD